MWIPLKIRICKKNNIKKKQVCNILQMIAKYLNVWLKTKTIVEINNQKIIEIKFSLLNVKIYNITEHNEIVNKAF